MADGRILIDTKINTKGILEGYEEIINAARRMASDVEHLSSSVRNAFARQADSLQTATRKYTEQEQKVESLKAKLEELKEQKFMTDEYKNLDKSLEEIQEKISAIQKQWAGSGFGNVDLSRMRAADSGLNELYLSMEKILQKQEEMKASGTAFAPDLDRKEVIDASEQLLREQTRLEDMAMRLGTSYDALKSKIEDYNNILKADTSEQQRLQNIANSAQVSSQKIIELRKELSELSARQADLEKAGLGVGFKEYDKNIIHISQLKSQIDEYKRNLEKAPKRNIFSGIIAELERLGNTAKKTASFIDRITGNKLSEGIKKLSSALFGVSKASEKSNVSFGKSLKTILKYGLGIRSLYALINKLRTAIVNGFRNLAQYSNATNATLSGLISSLEQCKNALATAFDPILQAIAPALNYLISLVTAAATAIAQLISALTGKGTFIKAVKVQKDYAKSLKGTGGAAKKAGKEAEDALAPFDKLNVMAEENAGGSGGGGGGGGVGGISPEDMFETVDISSEFSNLADAIKKAWNDADFTDIGEMLGGKIRDGLNNIPWDRIQGTAEKVGKSLATLLNGVVSTEGLPESIGKTIGEAINTGIIGINAFLDNTAWDKVGEFIGNGANTLVDTINWEGLGHLFASKFNAIFTTFGSFAATFDWTEFGTSIGNALSTAIQDFDWIGAGESLGVFFTGLENALKALIDTTDWTSLGSGITSAIASFLENVDWGSVGGLLSSFLTGLCDFLTGLIKGINWSEVPQNIIDAISDFFQNFNYKETFGSIGELIGTAIAAGIDLLKALGEILVNSWNGVVSYFKKHIEDSGGNIVEGLFNGIVQALKNIGNWIKTNIFDPFINGFKNAFGIHSPSTVMQEMGTYLMEGLLNGITELISQVIDKFVEIKDAIFQKWEEIKSNTGEAWENIKSTISEKVNNIKENASTAFENVKSTISEKWQNIKQDTSTKWQEIKNGLTQSWNTLKESATPIFIGLKDTVLSAWKDVQNDSSWDAIKNNLFNIWDSLASKAKEIFSGISETVKNVWEGIKNFGSNVKTSVSGIVSSVSGGSGNKTMSLRTSYIPPSEPVTLPRLASGTVVPPRAGEFAAILGDNRRETEVVSPLSTMKQAVLEAMEQAGGLGGGDINLTVNLDGRVIYQDLIKRNRAEKKRTGTNPLLA